MLIALLIAMLSGGGADIPVIPKETQKMVSEVIVEADRARLVKREMKRINKTNKAYGKFLRKKGKAFYKLLAQYDAEEEDFQPLVDDIHAERVRVKELFLDAIFEIRDQTTREEWDALFGQTAIVDYDGEE